MADKRRVDIGFTVRGAQKEYKIERLWENGAELVVVDGVRCSPEVLESLIVSPCEDRWLRFERQGDTVTAHQFVVRGGIDLAEPASCALGSYLLRRARIQLVGNGVVEPAGIFQFLQDEIEDLDRECDAALKGYAGA